MGEILLPGAVTYRCAGHTAGRVYRQLYFWTVICKILSSGGLPSQVPGTWEYITRKAMVSPGLSGFSERSFAAGTSTFLESAACMGSCCVRSGLPFLSRKIGETI